MATGAGDAIAEDGEAPARRRRRYGWKKILFGAIAGLLALVLVLLAALDTPPGRRFIIDQIEQLAPASGLKIKIGRIDGSIYGEMQISDLRLYDPEGLWLEVPALTVDWRPLAFLTANRLRIESASSDYVILRKLPALIPSDEPQPLLPGFDIYVGDLAVERLRIAEGIAGERRDAALAGSIDIRDGRARVELRARSLDSGERLALDLDAEPDGDAFDLDLQLQAPADGIIAGLTGIERALTVDIAGQGTWTSWEGEALIDSGDARAVDLNVAIRDGTYQLGGMVRTGELFDPGIVTRLTAPQTTLNASGNFEGRRFDGDFELRSAAAAIAGNGAFDLAESRFEGVFADIRLLEPSALVEDMRGRDVRLQLRLDGGFSRAGFTYLLTAPQAAFGATGVTGLRIGGEGRLSEMPIRLPLSASADRVTGVGETAGEILRNVRIDGAVLVTERQIVADGLDVRSDRFRGDLSVLYELSTGGYQVGVDGAIDRYYIPGFGTVDLSANVEVRPGPGGRFALTGRARGIVRSLENATVANLAGGLPRFDANISYGADGRFGFTDLRIQAPDLSFAGRGRLDADGTIYVAGSGQQSQYGPVRLTAEGNPSRPRLALALANPLPSAGIANVEAQLNPTAEGYAYRVSGDSLGGPFTSNGDILLPSGAPIEIAVAELAVADTISSGRLTLADAGIVGRLGITGTGLEGTVVLEPVGGVQAVRVDLEAENAELGGAIATTVRQATVDLDALLYPEAPEIVGRVEAFGVRRRGVSLARIEADIDMLGGRGTIDAEIGGARGREFEFSATADIAPDTVIVTGGGSFEGDPITLSPLRATRTEDGWRIAESTIEYAGGGATVSGLVGGSDTRLDARLDSIPLSVVDIFLPETGLGGIATGRLVYDQPAGQALPYVDAELRIRSLTREGFALRPRPVNLGINARLSGGRLAARGIMESDGEEIMRGQVRIDPIDQAAGFAGLTAAPLFAELRYSGPAETIWQLTGNELFSITGPLAGRADARGTLDNPQIVGEIRTENARLESALTGTVVEGITTRGRFDGATFNLPEFTGTTPGGGTVSGSARFDLGLAGGLGMDVALDTRRALLLRRDDIEARVSGPLAITLQAPPGTAAGTETARPEGRIEGDLTLVEGRFALGQAAPAAAIPQLNVVEINRPLDEPEEPPPPIEWTLAIDVAADNRFDVVGLGLDSEWAADLEVRGSIADFRIFGDMDLVRGAYSFAGRRFELERGNIEFYGNSPVNPALDIVAEGGVEDLQATINIGGNAQNPEIRFASVPALPESELISRLLFGTSITNLSAFEAIQLGAAVASLQGGGGGGLNPINALRDAIGLDRLRIVPADPAEDRETAIAAGFYITRRLYAEVISDGQGYSASRLEFQLTRWLSLLSSISTVGRVRGAVEISRDY